MSVDSHFQFVTPILVQELFDGRLNKIGVIEIADESADAFRYRILSDGRTSLAVSEWSTGKVFRIDMLPPATYSSAANLMNAIAECLGIKWAKYSEGQPEYYGLKTKEELDAMWFNLAQRDCEKFYADILQFVAGDDQAFQAGTNGRIDAEKARKLISEDPSLVRPEKKDELLLSINNTYWNEVIAWQRTCSKSAKDGVIQTSTPKRRK